MSGGFRDITQIMAAENLRGLYRFLDDHAEYKDKCKSVQLYHAYRHGYISLDYIRLRNKPAYNMLKEDGLIKAV